MHKKLTSKNRGMGLLKSIGLCLAVTFLAAGSDVVARAQVVHGHVLVRMLPNVSASILSFTYNTCVQGCTPSGNVAMMQTPAGIDDTVFAQLVNTSALVQYAVPDLILNSPEFESQQFHLAFDAGPNPGNYTNQQAFSQVDLGHSWRYTTGKGAVIALLDTGASFNHPALQGHYLPGYNVLNPALPPNDVAVPGTSNIAVGHGTMIAGIMARVAPNAQILPIKVLDSTGMGTLYNVLAGLDYAVQSGAQVISMSMGSPVGSPALAQALKDAKQSGALIVASAGNYGLEMVDYPAAYPFVVAVTSVEANNVLSSYSNYGPQIDLVAPGTGIRSTYINGGYANWSGTSFSVPFVSAEAALLFAEYPGIGPSHVARIIAQNADSVDCFNPQYAGLLGYGLIDIQNAVFGDD